MKRQTSLINALRAHLAEFGIVAPVGRNGVEDLLYVIADPDDERVPEVARECLAALGAELQRVKAQNIYDRPIVQLRLLMKGAAGTLPALLLELAATATMGQPRLDGSETPAQLRERHADYLKQCMRDWDAATHMTKQEWAHTCRRVVGNRVKYLLDRSKQK